MKKTKNEITDKESMTIWINGYDKEMFEQPYLLRADKIELKGKEIYFYFGKELIFKIWLKKEYKNLEDALKKSKIKVIK